MDARLPLSQEVLDRTPSEVVQLLHRLLARIEKLEAENRELKARLNLNSANSSKPPSTDPPHVKRKPPTPPSGRSRGGQPGHPRHERPLVPPEEIDQTVECRPERCADCGKPLAGEDPDPRRHQVAEIPPLKPHVVEYRLHTLACACCGGQTTGSLPADAPRGCFGPRLTAMVSMLSGSYRLGKRPVRQLLADLFGLNVSLGMVCKLQQQSARILQTPYDELCEAIRNDHVHVDETGWKENKRKAWLWVVVAPCATVFHVASSRGGSVVRHLLGKAFGLVVHCDRWSAYQWLKRLQCCWAHLRRDFQAMIDRGGVSKPIGEALLDHSNNLFHWWHQVRDGTMTRSTLQKYVGLLRQVMRTDFERGAACGCAKTAGTCRELLDREAQLWTFLWNDGVEPTNNAAERALRHAVVWRKCSGGTDSSAGSRFVERMLSIVATCRQQSRHVLEYLTACHQAAIAGQPIPSLIPQPATASRAA
jgi:transposase